MGRDFAKNVDFVAFLFINFRRRIVLVAPQSEVSTDICIKKTLMWTLKKSLAWDINSALGINWHLIKQLVDGLANHHANSAL